jgi:hypothetical protein
MSQPELLQVVEPDLDSVTDETLHMIIALDDFGLRPSLEMAQVICRRLIRAERQVADLIRERDEARAEFQKATNSMWAAVTMRLNDIPKAEARGYERGVQEAAKEIEKIAAIFDHPSVYMGGPSKHAKRRAKEIAAGILALLEKPTETKQP